VEASVVAVLSVVQFDAECFLCGEFEGGEED
jgi:hypothetical protein